jgi:hypothetical protein
MKIPNSNIGYFLLTILVICGGCSSENQYLSNKMDGFWKITSIRDEYETGGLPIYPGRTSVFNVDYPDSLHFSELKSFFFEKYNKGAGKASGYIAYYGNTPTKLIDNWCMAEPFDSIGGGFFNKSDTTGFLSIYLPKMPGVRYVVRMNNRQRQTWKTRFSYRGKAVIRTIEVERDKS